MPNLLHGREAAAGVISEVCQGVSPGDMNPAARAGDSQPGLIRSDDRRIPDGSLEPLLTPDQLS
jgi:hypothetical protein